MPLAETRPKLLLIDDCEPQRSMYELALAPNFEILTAARGFDGVKLAVATRPAAILLDVLMPEMDGWETCTRLKSHPATEVIPVILLTGTTDVDLTDHAMAVGAAAVVTKPCSVERLLHTIRAAMRGAPAGATDA
jgi:DNA-binding response OmpR family regulator